MKNARTLLLAIAAVVTPSVTWADVWFVSADAMVSAANPSTSFGNIPQILVGGGLRIV